MRRMRHMIGFVKTTVKSGRIIRTGTGRGRVTAVEGTPEGRPRPAASGALLGGEKRNITYFLDWQGTGG